MRTAFDTEFIVTDYITGSANEYILVTMQDCRFEVKDEKEGEEGDEKKDWEINWNVKLLKLPAVSVLLSQ